MTTKHRMAAAIVVAVVVGGVMLAAQAADPLIGTWKINLAKSKGVKSGTSKIEAVGDGVKFTVDFVGTDGTDRHWEFTAKYDGKDNPVTGNNPYGDVVALTRVDAQTTRITNKQGGKVTATSTIVVSADGKTRTTTTKGTGAKGEPIDVVSFYEKQ